MATGAEARQDGQGLAQGGTGAAESIRGRAPYLGATGDVATGLLDDFIDAGRAGGEPVAASQ